MRATISLLAVLVITAIVSACGSGGNGSGFSSSGSSGGGSGGSGGSSGGSLTGSSSGGGSFGDSGAGSTSGGMIPPKGCDSSCPAAGGMCVNHVCVIDENPGGVDTGTQGQLNGGGHADSQFGWLYPYDKTVFPRGLLPPKFQFGGTAADAAYVHITCASLDYKGYFKPASSDLTLSQPVWTAITNAASGPNDPLVVQVTKISGGQVTGPISESWPIAQGSLRGVVYYETYDSQIAGGVGSVGIMQIQPGATAPTVVKKGCGNVCHTASADGSTLVACVSLDFVSASYDLKTGASVIKQASGNVFTYGGLYPDGSMEMSATNYRTWINAPSRLYDTSNAQNIPATGWDGVITNAGTTAFSPDGKHIAFVHEDKSPNVLAMMDFDKAATTFSNLQDLATAPQYAGWPAFTPDSKWVVYHSDTNDAFETDAGAQGDLYIVDTATKAVHALDALNGYAPGGGSTYLPAMDPNLNFAPTVLPEAVGGYFWVVFTSHRSYGNTLPTQQPGSDGTADEYGKLWVAALDIGAADGMDPSHPAFYLDGQETNADNLRGFWVLPPCKGNGGSCSSGDECCNGFCRPAGDGGPLECVPPPGGCSNDYERCMTAADCCNSTDQCINGFCSPPAAQ